MKEEVKGDDELARGLRGRDTAGDVMRGAGGHRARPALRRRAHRAAPADLRLQVDLVARVRVQDLGRGPGADHRGDPRLPRDRLRLPGRTPGRRATTSRRPRPRSRRRRAASRATSCERGARADRCAMNPLTPDHHFYIDQGTNARLRLVLIAIGRKLAEAGGSTTPRTSCTCTTTSCACCMADQQRLRRAGARRPTAATPARTPPSVRPPSTGSAPPPRTALGFPYCVAVGLPGEVPRRRAVARRARSRASPPRPAWSRAPRASSPRSTSSTRSSDGEILVCRMTNPAWVVLFTKIRGLVTDAGGTVSHPAVVAREFGIPAVVGTSERRRAGSRPATASASTAPPAWSRSWRDPRSRRVARALDAPRRPLALRAERGEEATVVAGGTFLGILMNQGFLEPVGAAVARRRRRAAEHRGRGRRAAAGRDGHPPPVERDAARARRLADARPRVRPWSPARGCATRRPSAACSPTPTTPRTRPAALPALGARAVLRSPRGERAVPIEELILGYYETCIAPGRAARRGAGAGPRRRGPCTASSARARARTGRASPSRRSRDERRLRVVVGAVAERPQEFPDLCDAAGARSTPRWRPRSAAVRRADRAHRRRARLGGLPAAGRSRSRCGARWRSSPRDGRAASTRA